MMRRFIQLLILLAPVTLFAWLLWQETVPTGTFFVRHAVNERSPFIDRLLPDGRVALPAQDEAGDWTQVVSDDPTFFFVHPHRAFDQVDAEVWFKNTEVPIVELGILADPLAQAYDLRPLQNRLIDRTSWDRMDREGIVLLQREKTYASIGDFLADPPPRSEIATYQYALSRPFVLEGYVPSNESRTLDVSLRGFHSFKTYIKDETLAFDVVFMDMNRDDGADPVSVFVSRDDGTPIAEVRAEDDGNITADQIPSVPRHLTVSVPGLAEGVYKVELRAERDVFFRTITTTQQKIVFLNNVYLGDEIAWKEPARSVRFWTEGKNLTFTTQHADGVQDVFVGSQTVSVSAPYTPVSLDVVDEGVVQITSSLGDVLMNTDGHIAFASEQYFNPDPVRLLADTDLDRLGVDYVIAKYVSPRMEGDWVVAKASFDVSALPLQDDAWKFVVSTPGIRERGETLSIGRIDLTFTRPPFSFRDAISWFRRLFVPTTYNLPPTTS